jgi:hypothetical protein
LAFIVLEALVNTHRRSATEEIIGTVQKVSGHTYDSVFDLILTSERVVVAIIQRPEDFPVRLSTWSFLVGNRFSRSRQEAERLEISKERQLQLETFSLDKVIALNPGSFAILYQDISAVEIKQGLFDRFLIFHLAGTSKRGMSRTFTLKKKQLPLVRDLLSKTPLRNFKESR